jgi:hypothetical protein
MGVKIYSRKSKIKINYPKMGCGFVVRPLEYDQKCEILAETHKAQSGMNIFDLGKATAKYIKYMVIGVHGISDENGNDYSLKFDGDNNLTDECVSDLMNISLDPALSVSLSNFIHGVPTELLDQSTGEKLKDVKIVHESGGVKKK